MDVRRADELSSRELTEFGSRGAIAFLSSGDARVVRIELEVGGSVGRHPAAADQILIVLEGTAVVRGGSGEAADLGAGDVVRWAAGEEHETSARSRFVALIVEAPSLQLG
jgi:quercetin dioxygenase-like cupin family protein